MHFFKRWSLIWPQDLSIWVFFCKFILYTRYLLWTTLLSIAEHFLMCFLMCTVGILSCPLEYCRSMMSRTPTRELTLALPSTRLLMQKEHCPPQSYAIVKRLSSRSSILHQVRTSKLLKVESPQCCIRWGTQKSPQCCVDHYILLTWRLL